MSDDLSVTRVSGPNQPSTADPSATVARSADPLTAVLRASGEGLPDVPGYEVTREIARGGMGRVLAARDRALSRPVAIKVLLPRAGRDGARRFVTEAEITAQLPHPNIPPVYALGYFGDGAPFLAMKLIEGHTLAAQLRDRATPAEDLSRFVQAFEHVCLAVGFAHARGVIHRDLKPANVMVGAFGEVQVMDWGLAKGHVWEPEPGRAADRTTDGEPEPADLRPEPAAGVRAGDSARLSNAASEGGDTDATMAGQVLGTPSYMSPEQARGEPVGARTDVFSLGAILCEILTGARPFSGRSSAEVLGATAAGDLGEPLARLDASEAPPELVLLAKRCLAPEAVNRPANGKAVADAVALHRAGAENRLRAAESERAAAEARAIEQRKRRRVQLALLATVAVFLLGAAAVGWRLDHLATARRAENERIEREHAVAELRQREKDDRAAADNRRVLADDVARCEAALRADDGAAAATALVDIGHRETLPGGEEFAARIARCRADLALLVRLDEVETFAWTPVDGVSPTVTDVQARLVAAFGLSGLAPGTAPAEETARRVNESLIRERLLFVLDLWHGAAGAPDLCALLRAADPDPTRDALRAAVQARDEAQFDRLAGGLADQPARFVIALAAPARPLLSPARRRALLTAEWGRAPGNFRVLMALGGTYPMNRKAGAIERARWFQAAVAARPGRAAPWNNLAVALFDNGQFDEALGAGREALRLDPRDVTALSLKAMVLRAQGDGRGAVAVYEELLRAGPNRPYPAFHNNFGNALATAGDLDGAIAKFRKALELDPALGPAHANLGNALLRKGDLDGAVRALRASILYDPRNAGAQANLGSALVQKRDAEGAVAAYREAFRLNPTNPGHGSALGNLLWDLGAPDAALGVFRDALRYSPTDTGLRNNLGMLLRRADDLKGAIAEFKEVLRLEPKHARAWFNLGLTLKASGDPAGAAKAYRELLALDPNHSAGHNGLGNALWSLGDLDGAIAEFRTALRIAPQNGAARGNLAEALKEKANPELKLAPPPHGAAQ